MKHSMTNVLIQPVTISRGLAGLFITINLLLIAACLLSQRHNSLLQKEVTTGMLRLEPSTGTLMPTILGEDWKGTTQSIAYDEDPRPILFYTFTQKCPHCKENWHAMRELQSMTPKSLRIVYYDPNPDVFTQDYLSANGMSPSPLLVKLQPEADSAYHAPAVPNALLLDRTGRVIWWHMGELASSDTSKAKSLAELSLNVNAAH
jgi:hypothetical protein